MNKALTEVLHQLLPKSVCDGYAPQLFHDLNRAFGITFQYFYAMFDNDDPIEKEQSCITLSANWGRLSFKDLRARIKNGVACTAFANVPLTNAQTINTRVAVILRTTMYVTQYKEWLTLANAAKANLHQALYW